ncbi:M16 family metallopeptidase [Desulfobacterium sp. N47]
MSQPENKTILPNRIGIITKNMPHACSVSMGIWVKAGTRDESQEENGISHFVEHMLFKGTSKRSAFQIAKEFDAMGGNSNAFTSMETTCYHTKVITSHVKTATDLLFDIFLNSLFDTKEIEKERPVIIQEIGMVEDSPEDYIHLLSGQCFFKNNPLGFSVLGTRSNVTNFKPEKVKEFFELLYQPSRIVISVAGNIEHNNILDLVGPIIESYKNNTFSPERITPDVQGGVNIFEKDLEQVHICALFKGLPISDERRYAFSLINTILGGNMSSRLFQEIREKRGLAYSVYSFISSYSDTGMFGAFAAVDPENAFDAADLIIKEIKKIIKHAIDDQELKDAVEYTKGCLLLASESTDNQMFRQAQNEINFKRHIPLHEITGKIESVTKDEVYDLACLLFGSGNLSLTVLGPVPDKSKFMDVLNS